MLDLGLGPVRTFPRDYLGFTRYCVMVVVGENYEAGAMIYGLSPFRMRNSETRNSFPSWTINRIHLEHI